MSATDHRYLVTGSMGCLGAWTLYHLVQQGKKAISFDLSADRYRLHALLTPAEQEAITFVQGDLTDSAAVLEVVRGQGITHIIHLAALQVPFCRAKPIVGAQVNVVGTVNIFEAAREAGIPHLTYASSVAVYGPAGDYPPGPVAPDARQTPRTLYGVYKVADEGLARVYWQDHKIGSTGLRPYTVYGVGRDQGITSEPTKAMQAVVDGQPYHISFGGVMQFHLASDVALQFIAAAEQPSKGAPVFAMGTPAISVEAVAQIIRDVRPDAQVTVGDTILPFPEEFDSTPLRHHFATVYETPIAEGVRQTIAHFERLKG